MAEQAQQFEMNFAPEFGQDENMLKEKVEGIIAELFSNIEGSLPSGHFQETIISWVESGAKISFTESQKEQIRQEVGERSRDVIQPRVLAEKIVAIYLGQEKGE